MFLKGITCLHILFVWLVLHPPLFSCLGVRVLSVACSGQCGLHLPTPPVLSHNNLYSTCSDAQLCQVSSSHRTFAHVAPPVWNSLSSLSPRVNPVYSADLCSTSVPQRIPLIPVPAPSPAPARFSFLPSVMGSLASVSFTRL